MNGLKDEGMTRVNKDRGPDGREVIAEAGWKSTTWQNERRRKPKEQSLIEDDISDWFSDANTTIPSSVLSAALGDTPLIPIRSQFWTKHDEYC